MRNSLDLEAGNKIPANSNRASVVYGYPVGPAASHPGNLSWTRTTSSSSSISLSDAANAAPPVNHRAKGSLDKILFSVVIGSLLAGIVWCGIGEVMNTHNYPKFKVDSISFSPLNNETGASNWTVGVYVRNTNRYTRMAYDDFQVSVYYKDELLSTAMVSPLYLGHKSQTLVVASLQGQSREKKNLGADEIGEDRRDGIVNFDVVLQVGFSSNVTEQGTMIGSPYRCYSPLDLLLGVLLSSKS